MNTENALLVTLNNYPESCNLCRSGIIFSYADLNKWLKMDHFAICAIKSGRTRNYFAEEVIELRKGDVYIVVPGTAFRVEYLEPDTQIYGMQFTKEFLGYDPLGETIKDRLITYLSLQMTFEKIEDLLFKVPLNTEDQTFIISLFEKFNHEFNTKRREAMFEMLHSILLLMVNTIGWRVLYQPKTIIVEQKYRRINKMITDSIEYVNQHYTEKITLEQITREFGVSKTAYCTIFKQITGETFHTYLNRLRCETASGYLINSELSIEEIAFSTGFVDVSSFYRNFSKAYGMSPGKYRKVYCL